MNVYRTKVPFGRDETRHRTVVETDPCIHGTVHARMVRQELLGYIAQDPNFSQCGGYDFQTMKMFHDGTKYVVEFEAIVTTA